MVIIIIEVEFDPFVTGYKYMGRRSFPAQIIRSTKDILYLLAIPHGASELQKHVPNHVAYQTGSFELATHYNILFTKRQNGTHRLSGELDREERVFIVLHTVERQCNT